MTTLTPRINAESNDRLTMSISDEDRAKICRGKPWQADVTDQNTGRRYHIRGAACGLPRCMCDAVIVKEIVH
jgi:hypothetical protein